MMRGPHPQSHVAHRSRGLVSSQNVLSPHSRSPRPPKPARVIIRIRGPQPKSHVTLQLFRHVKNQNRQISSTTGP